MYANLGAILPFALGIAINAASIVAVILLLTSNHGLAKGLAYLAGWLLGLMTQLFVMVLLVSGWNFRPNSAPSQVATWVMLFAGIVLLLMAYVQWRQRPSPDAEIMPIEWLRSLPRVTPFMAFSAGLFFGLFNFKNLLLSAAAALVIGEAQVGVDQSLIMVLAFVAIATVGIAAPVFVSLTRQEWSKTVLADWEYRLSKNNVTISYIALAIIGVQMLIVVIGRL